jgi:hypothetical protein
MPAWFATHPPAVAGKSSGAAMLNRSAVFFQVFQNGMTSYSAGHG